MPNCSFFKAIISQQCESCGRGHGAAQAGRSNELKIGDHCFEMCEEDNQIGLTWKEVENCEVGRF